MLLNLENLVSLLRELLNSYKKLNSASVAKRFDCLFNATTDLFKLSREELYKKILETK